MRNLSTAGLILCLAQFICPAVGAEDFTARFTPTHGEDSFPFTLAQDSVVSLVSVLTGELNAGNSGFGIASKSSGTDVVRSGFAHPDKTEGPWPLKAGTYSLKLWNNNWNTGTYLAKLTVAPPAGANDTEPNDTAATATNLPLNTMVSGLLGYYDGSSHDYTDYYRLTLSSSGTIKLTAQNENTLSGAFGYTLYSSDGSTVLRDTSASLSAGTYFVGVWTNSAWSYGNYSLRADFTPASTSTGNSGTSTAGQIIIQTPVTSSRNVAPTLSFAPPPGERSGNYNLYVAGLYNGTYYFLTLDMGQMKIVQYSGGADLPVYQVAAGTDLYVENTNGGFSAQTWMIPLGDLSNLRGLQLFAGFGRNTADMLARKQVQLLYTVE